MTRAADRASDGRPALWVLNLDAEYELADPQGYTPSQATQQRTRVFAERVRGLLVPGDQVLDAHDGGAVLGARGAAHAQPTERAAPSFIGRTWCPTPRALSRLESAGVELPPSPSLAVLQRVNDRRFSIELDPGPLQARYMTDVDATLAALERPAPSGRWLMKRAFGLAGRGHRRVDGAATDADARWLRNSFKQGHGVALEPWVERIVDVALHGFVARQGDVVLGRALLQRCDAYGTWQETLPLPASALSRAEEQALNAAALRAGHALHSAGYFGPFGIDAFAFRSVDGGRAFQALVEINARYSMGWPLSGLSHGPLDR